jgi:hypothetical protein
MSKILPFKRPKKTSAPKQAATAAAAEPQPTAEEIALAERLGDVSGKLEEVGMKLVDNHDELLDALLVCAAKVINERAAQLQKEGGDKAWLAYVYDAIYRGALYFSTYGWYTLGACKCCVQRAAIEGLSDGTDSTIRDIAERAREIKDRMHGGEVQLLSATTTSSTTVH